MDRRDDRVDQPGSGRCGASFDPTSLLPILTGATSFVGAIFGYILLPVWVFYLLKDRVSLTQQFDRSLPAAWRFDTWAVLRIVRRLFGQWVRAQLVLGVTVGVFTFIGLLLLSRFVDPVFGRYAVLLSVTAGILELVPIIGPIIAAVPAVLLAATAGLEAVIAASGPVHTRPADREQRARAEDPGRRHRAAPRPRDVRDRHRRVARRACSARSWPCRSLRPYAMSRATCSDASARTRPEALAASIAGLGLDVHPGIPGRPTS